MKKIFFLAFVLVVAMNPIFSQLFSLSDSTITFKNQEGKVLSKEEVQQLIKDKCSIRQENINGKKVITIIPSGHDELALQRAKLEAFKNSLLNRPVTSFHLVDLNKQTWDSKELKGKVVVINLWFTACEPCIMEMPFLNKLVANNKNNPVVFIAPAPENENLIKKFLKKFQFDYNIIPTSVDFISSLNIENYPTHLVIDKEGIIKQVFIGYSDDIQEKLQQEINRIVNGERSIVN